MHRFLISFALLLFGSLLYSDSLLVTLPPQEECVRFISGGLYQIHSLVPQGSIPENYAVTPRQLTTYQDCLIVFTIGIPLETQLNDKLHALYPTIRFVDGRQGMKLRKMDEDHDHGKRHEQTDPHVWLSVDNMKVFATTVCNELSLLAPEHKNLFEQNKLKYMAQLDELKNEMKKRLSPFKGQTLLVNHPAFGYVCDTFSLRQLPIEKDGKEASAHHLAEVTQQINRQKSKVLFVQPQFNQKNCRQLAQRHRLKIVILNPLPAPYLQGMREMTSTLAQELDPSL